jgi:predicted Zn-dependent protease
MGCQDTRAWVSRLYRRRGLLVALVLLLFAVVAAPWVWAGYHFRQGSIELERYHPDKARRHLASFLRVWPRNVSARLLASRAARQLALFDEAEEHLRQAQREGREQSEEVMLEWALHRATLGDLDRTEAYLLPLVQEDSERSFLACEALAEGGRRNYRIPQVLAVLDLWLERRPNNVRALLLRGHLWGHIHSYSKAVPEYRRVLELDPEQEEARRWLAVCLVESAHWREALPFLKELQREHPTNRDAQVLLARCLGNLGQHQEAVQMLEDVLAERPDDVIALRSLGETLLQDQRPAEAEPRLRHAVEIAPHEYKTNWFLYQSLQQQEKTAEAERQLERTEEVERLWNRFHAVTQHEIPTRPHDIALQAELGTLLLDLGYTEAGRNWLLGALNRDPQARPVHEALARYYQQQGDAVQAAKHRRQARALSAPTTGPASGPHP